MLHRITSALPLLAVALLSVTAARHAVAGAADTTMGLPPTIPAGATVEKLATLPTESYTVGRPFTEGATCAPNGDVYFVEQNSSKILRWSVADHELSVFMHPSGYANGMSFDAHGNLIACADERNELWSISITETETIPYPKAVNPAVGEPPTAETITLPKHTVIMEGHYGGEPLNGPNDLWIRPDGGIYFTDFFWPRDWWTPGRGEEQDMQTVYFLSPDHHKLTRVIPEFLSTEGRPARPNGIVGTPDGKTLYVADIGGGETWSFAVQPDGSLTDKKLVCSFGSDGMTLDNQGNLYMSARARPAGVTVVNVESGQQIGFIPVPEQPANMCFGGPNHDTLYMTARTGFYSIRTNVRGASNVK